MDKISAATPQPGRELDKLVAEKVMGLEVVITRWGKQKQYCSYTIGEPSYYDDAGEMKLHNPLPPYSEDIAAAWEVFEKIGPNYCLLNDGTFYFCYQTKETGGTGRTVSQMASTAPHAICLAALAAAT